MGQAALDDFLAFGRTASTAESSDYKRAGADAGASEDKRPAGEKAVEYDIEGVRVRFPFEAYPCQIKMLQNIMTTLNAKSGNALLESPTGSGKSMALLCGVLAWLEERKKAVRADAQTIVSEHHKLDAIEEKMGFSTGASAACSPDKENGREDNYNGSDNCSCNGNEDDDFEGESPARKKRMKSPVDSVHEKDIDQIIKSSVLPKIYITSRTHRQIAQLVKELERTTYRPKFVVLASRSHYCINETVRKAKDINEACRESLGSGEKSCTFFHNISKVLRRKPTEFTPDCDIEDLIQAGKKDRFCPYFVARGALEKAEVVFAPYNYLVDPVVREAMGIELNNDIVVVDEAHNIEDVSRESGSFEISDDAFNAIQAELQQINTALRIDPKFKVLHMAHETQSHVVSIIANWLKHGMSLRGQVRRDFETSTTIWHGDQIIQELQSIGISHDGLASWSRELSKIVDKANETQKRREDRPVEKEFILSFGSCQVLKGLYNSLANMMRDNNHYLTSYKMVKYQATKMEASGKKLTTTLGFWCLNPEVVFRSLTAATKSVILTSGTLSPMETFSLELGTKFEQRLEAMHIIDESQTWIGCVPNGPDGSTFIGNFKTMDAYSYQDDLARALLQIVLIVPAGVLCFVPSYGFLDKVVRRMQNTGVYEEITRRKKIFVEPRNGTPKDFEKLMKNYYTTIRDYAGRQETTGEQTQKGIDGALLLAVYRGKISEGLDLKDDNCRAVVAAGIPYPAFKDPKVVLKREFNDQHAMGGRPLLSGHHWYESQAFRALNQALGRCIRHRNDWGAIILLEQRFTIPRNISQLSRWVRAGVQTHSTFAAATASLAYFISRNTRSGPARDAPPGLVPSLPLENNPPCQS